MDMPSADYEYIDGANASYVYYNDENVYINECNEKFLELYKMTLFK